MAQNIKDAVLAAEQVRCAAMLANDAGALEAILDPRLSFSHANGQIDDKAVYRAKMAQGRINYLSIDWTEQQVIPLEDKAALLTGRMTSQVRVEEIEKRLDNRVLAAWAETGGSWRLVAFQSTPLKV